ncbi:transporter substrate-binding domain-containing protein [Bdellovibrio sp. HCB274]|uniref:transporter substrate-binding domain-containing protein n=1 Tax=Bdellovibrio sp. HCB274 TaxID=3394361 RepID=UPI0039B6CCBB
MKFGFVLTFIFILAGAVQAASLPCVGTYKVAVNESEPLYFRDGNAQRFIGASQDVLNELAVRTGCRFSVASLNRTRLISELKSFRIDLIVVTIKNPVFDELAGFIPMESIQREALVTVESGSKYKTVADLIKDPQIHFLILPALSVFFTKEESVKLRKEGRFITATSIQNSYEILRRTTQTAVVQGDWVNSYYINTMNLTGNYLRVLDPSKAFEVGIYYRSNIDNQKDLNAIKQALGNMVSDGTWKKITERYGNFKTKKPTRK